LGHPLKTFVFSFVSLRENLSAPLWLE